MTFAYMIQMAVAHGYRVEQVALREVRFRSVNGFYRITGKLHPNGWDIN